MKDMKPYVIAGPCSAETEEQVMTTARGLKDAGVEVFRAGIWKPRTRPGCFEGIGVPGLPWLQRVQSELGMKVCTEVAGARHIEECLAHGVDILWIGARTTANPFLVQEIADSLRGTDVPVLVKNPISPDLGLWIGALERLARAGVKNLGVIHRGFMSLDEHRYRNAPQWQIAIEMRTRYPALPFYCDPSHMSGKAEYVPEICQKAMNLGLDGLMIESHCNPSCALSDASQQLTPAEVGRLLRSLQTRDSDTQDSLYRGTMEQLRERIDGYDEQILDALAGRMEVSRQIGEIKKSNNVAILQMQRWDEILEGIRAEADARRLDSAFVLKVFNAIHDASVQEQNKVIQEG